MNTTTATTLLRGHSLTVNDAARLALEITEALGTEAENLPRTELLQLMRHVAAEGIKAVKARRNTVSFEAAAQFSLEARQGRRPTTVRDLRHFIGRMLKVEGIPHLPLRGMNATVCRRILQTAFGTSPSSYRKGRVILSSIFSYGMRQGWCDTNPVSGIEAPRIVEKPITPLTPQQIRQLEHAAECPEHQDMAFSLKLMLYCGVRPAEIKRINPQRDITEREIIIRPQTSKTGGGRVVPLRKIVAFLRSRAAVCSIPHNWEYRWRQLRRAAHLRHWQADCCRHTYASYHAAHFKNYQALQFEMGHRDMRLLLSRYVSPVSSRDAAFFWESP